MEQVQQIRSAIGGLPRRAQIAILVVAVITALVLVFVLRSAIHTNWAPVLTDTSAANVSKGQTALEDAGIRYDTNDAGTSLFVPKKDQGKANTALASANVAGAGTHTTCEETFSGGGGFMSSTSEQMRQQGKNCLQNELANNFEGMHGIKHATVILNVQAARLFTDEQLSSTASVKLEAEGGRPSATTVKAIKSMTAAAVPDLKASAVEVVDEHGLLGGNTGGGKGKAIDEATLKLRVTQDYKNQVENDLTRKFEAMAGPGKVVVLANPVLDMDKIRREVKDYGGPDNQKGVPLEEHTKVENLNGTGTRAVGPTGTASNVATDTSASGTQSSASTGNAIVGATTDTAASRGYQNADTAVTYGVDEVADARVVAQGAVTTNRISVVVDPSVPTATVNAIKNAAQAWEGGNAADSFSFDEAPIHQATGDVGGAGLAHRAQLEAYLKWLIAGLGLIGMAFLLRRQLNQRTEELLYPIEEPYQLEQANFEPIPLAELEAAVAAATSVENQKRLELQRKVEKIADDKPSDVATQLRGWMMEDADQYGYTQPATRR